MMQRLTQQTSTAAGANAVVPAYDREALKPGIVHLGLGAFHRAHQAVYTDNAMNHSGGDWGIIGVSMRSDSVARQLQPQDLLYSVLSEDADSQALQVVGALREIIVAPQQPERLCEALASSDIHLVTLTVTEKGYCLGPDGWSLDTAHPEVVQDLANPARPQTTPGILALGLRERLAGGGAPLTILSCDNLAENSARLRAVLVDYLQRTWPEVIAWLEQSVSFPSSMVDRIVPAMTAAGRDKQSQLLGLRDEAAVATEPFSQWIIEDDFAAGRPRWEAVGVQLVEDIRPFEALKLRLLNASHSAIAYLGLLAGRETVADVMADPELGPFIRRLMSEELLPALEVPPGFDVEHYRDQLLARFSNPRLHHRCAQIAMDGTEKIPQRWLPTLRAVSDNRTLLLGALAAWSYFVLATDLPLQDARADRLEALRGGDQPLQQRLQALLELIGLPAGDPGLSGDALRQIMDSLALLARHGVSGLLGATAE